MAWCLSYAQGQLYLYLYNVPVLKQHAIKAYGGMETKLQALTSASCGSEWLISRSGHFIPGEIAPGAHSVRGPVGSRAYLKVVAKRTCQISMQPL
jgi:hypothetical protein